MRAPTEVCARGCLESPQLMRIFVRRTHLRLVTRLFMRSRVAVLFTRPWSRRCQDTPAFRRVRSSPRRGLTMAARAAGSSSALWNVSVCGHELEGLQLMRISWRTGHLSSGSPGVTNSDSGRTDSVSRQRRHRPERRLPPAPSAGYQSELEIIVQGRHIPRQRYWHTDLYERHGSQWQVVWSHATAAS
jgi:hypothetical protein